MNYIDDILENITDEQLDRLAERLQNRADEKTLEECSNSPMPSRACIKCARKLRYASQLRMGKYCDKCFDVVSSQRMTCNICGGTGHVFHHRLGLLTCPKCKDSK